MRCQNHDTNIGWEKLVFISARAIKCELCGKEFTLEEIRHERRAEYQHDLVDLQRAYLQDLAMLHYLSKELRDTQTGKT